MEGAPNNNETIIKTEKIAEKEAGNIVRWDKNSYEDTLKAFNGLEIGDVIVSNSGTKRKLIGQGDGIYTFEKIGADGKVTVESLSENTVYQSFVKALDHVEKGEKVEKSYNNIVDTIRDLKEGDVLHSKSGTFRVFVSRDGNNYKFERFGTGDKNSSVQTMTEEQLVAGFGNIESIKKK